MTIHLISYYANMLIFLPAPFIYLATLIVAIRSKLVPHRAWWILMTVTGMLAPVLFLAAQSLWVSEEHHEVVDDLSVKIWLVFDYVNASHYLISSLIAYTSLGMVVRVLDQIEDAAHVTGSHLSKEFRWNQGKK